MPATLPVTEIGKADNAMPANPHDFLHQKIRPFDGLQGLRQNHIIKTLISKLTETIIQICLDDINAGVLLIKMPAYFLDNRFYAR